MNLKEEDLDSFVEEELKKDITQEDSINPDVEDKLGEMGFLWDRTIKKLTEDGVCFGCKKQVDFSGGNIQVAQANNKDKGVISFIAVCPTCRDAELKRQEEEEKKKNAT